MIEDKYLFFWGHHGVGIGKHMLSQWYPSPMIIDGKSYSCAEQYMMAMKAMAFDDEETARQIMNTDDPRVQKQLGRKVKGFDDATWNLISLDVVVRGNFEKFSSSLDLWNFLESTSGKIIVEASPYDTVWGIGLSQDHPDARDINLWRGTNKLGFALMIVRKLLQKTK